MLVHCTCRLFLKPASLLRMRSLVWALSMSLIFVACGAKRSRSVKNKRQLNQRFFEIRKACENNIPSVDATAPAANINRRQSDPSSGQMESAHPLQQQQPRQPVGCAQLIFEESVGCITECISPQCHEKIYSSKPIEIGEIDLIRHAQFELCAKREMKERSRIERIDKRKASSAG